MNLVQILLPVRSARAGAASAALHGQVERELTERFGGLTAYAHTPARGLWEERPGRTTRDDIVVYEVMVDEVDAAWWAGYRTDLERRFAQEEVVIRAHGIRRL